MSQSTGADKVADGVLLTTEGNAKDFTKDQKEFLQATLDDLCKIGRKSTAENLNKYISGGHATISQDNPGTIASTKCPALGYLDPISSNRLNINQYVIDLWVQSRDIAAKFHDTGSSDKEAMKIREAQLAIRDMALTLVHEDVHMGQYAPQEIPKDENPAYETTIRESRRIIDEDMKKIMEILERGAKLPGDQELLKELIEDLSISAQVYQEKINSMQGEAIKEGKVDPEKFKTSLADMLKLVKDAEDLIKSANAEKGRSFSSFGRIMSTNGAFVSRGNIVGGTDHLGFANCLCNCGCSQAGWACGSGVTCVYDANPNAGCLCAGFGAGHAPVPSSGECYDGCVKKYEITGMKSNETPLMSVISGGYNAILPGDLIQTTGDTVILLNDGSKLLVKPGCILNFTSTESGKVRVNLFLGDMRIEHAAGGSAGAGGPEVQIADRRVQPEGTEFICQWDGGKGKVSVVAGSVNIANKTSGETIEAGEEMSLPGGTVGDYNLSADDGGLVAGIPLRDLILDDGEPEPFGEHDPIFEGGKIPDDWIWQDPASDAKFESSSSGGLLITVPDENEFWGYPGVTARQRSDAPRLLHKVTGDFDLQGRVYLDTEATDLATVEFLYYSPGSNIGLESGLMKQDLLGENCNLPGGGWLRTGGLNKLPVLGRPSEVTYLGYSAELNSAPDAPYSPVFLKFTRRGDVLKTYHSLDGNNWILSSREEVNVSQTIWVGWVFKRFAYDGLTDKNAVVTLDSVHLKTAESGSMPVPEWDQILQAGSAEINGDTIRLRMDGSGKGVTGVQKGEAIVGDFQATVSFQADGKTPESGESCYLALIAPNYNGHNETSIGWFIDTNHVSQLYTTEFHSSGQGKDGANDYTSDWSGRLRIVRQDGNISTYFWKDGGWKVLGDFRRGYPDPVYLGLEVSNERESSANASMAVDFTMDEIAGDVASSDARGIAETDASETPEGIYVSGTRSGDANGGYANGGYANGGYANSGYANEGYANSGYANEGYANSGYANGGSANGGYANGGYANEGYANSGYANGGSANGGYANEGYANSGYANGGYANGGYANENNGKETAEEPRIETSAVPGGESIVIFDNWNIDGVSNNPSCNPSFTITSSQMITYIDSYHWNYGYGTAEPGMISLVKEDGTELGPWQAEGQPGMNGVPNAYWIVHPYMVIPAGTYVILNSDQETWSQNSASGGCGFSKVQGYPDQSQPSRW